MPFLPDSEKEFARHPKAAIMAVTGAGARNTGPEVSIGAVAPKYHVQNDGNLDNGTWSLT